MVLKMSFKNIKVMFEMTESAQFCLLFFKRFLLSSSCTHQRDMHLPILIGWRSGEKGWQCDHTHCVCVWGVLLPVSKSLVCSHTL